MSAGALCHIMKTTSILYYHHNDNDNDNDNNNDNNNNNNFSTNINKFIKAKCSLKGFNKTKIITSSFEHCYFAFKNLILIYVSIHIYAFLKFLKLLKFIKFHIFLHRFTYTLKKMLNIIIILMQLSALYTYSGYCNFATTQISSINYTDINFTKDNQSSLIEGFSLALGYNITDTTMSAVQAAHNVGSLHMKDDDDFLTSIVNNTSSSVLMPTIGEKNIYNFISRENILKQHQFQNINNLPTTTITTTTDKTQETHAKLHISKISTCPSCSIMREKAKIDNLESIKMHILRRLHLSRVPHITPPMRIPENILENFYKNYSQRGKHENITFHKTNLFKKKNFDYEEFKLENSKNSKSSNEGDNFDENMQKDDYQAFNHDTSSSSMQTLNYDDDDVNSKNKKEETFGHFTKHIFEDDNNNYISHIHSIYIFPTAPRSRHNRRQEIFLFKFENNLLTPTKTILHIYIRGREYFRQTNSIQLNEENLKVNDVVIVINRAVRRTNTMNYTHFLKLMEYHQQIPNGLGKWIQIEIDQLTEVWKENPGETQGILIKGAESWMRNFIVTNDSNFILHVEVQLKEHRRHKRSTSLDCQESDNEVRCCRYPLKVNFTNFGWHFVVAPTSFDAYFCNGECKVGYLEQYTHTHLASLTTSATPCCSPTKMSSLNLLYFNLDQNLVMSTIPNMSVEKCSCS